ncbi:hypothetical protein [Micromonospora sp. DT31]|uniref:hypothetical protein n=1 Tax=Micromonospora sp. DT31 TaxID=3393434 RepID=UPI003CF3CFC2
MRARSALAGLAAVALLAAGCDSTPQADPTQPPTRPTQAAPSAGPRAAPLLDDCAALAAMVPREVSPGLGVDNFFPTPSPVEEQTYSVRCVLVGPSADDSRLRVQLQLRLVRPRVDPYELKPLTEWLRTKPREFASVSDCGTLAPWPVVPNGFRCFKDNELTREQSVAGSGKGTAVHVYVTVLQLDQRKPVPIDVVRNVSDKAAELTIKAAFDGI